MAELTLSSRVLAPKSRRGSLKRRVTPSKLTFKVIRVSGVATDDDAMVSDDADLNLMSQFRCDSTIVK